MKKSILILAAVSLSILSCSEEDAPEAVNKAPNTFEVTVTASEVTETPKGGLIEVKKLAKSSAVVIPNETYEYTVTWTDAVDPDGDSVTYDVEIGGVKIEEGTVIKSTVIEEDDLVDGTSQTVKVVAKDSKGATTTVNKSFTRSKKSL